MNCKGTFEMCDYYNQLEKGNLRSDIVNNSCILIYYLNIAQNEWLICAQYL